MFQGWILFFSAIFSGLIKESLPIAAILAGPLTAIVVVLLERFMDQREKLQDRKDMWLKDHWKDLAIYLENISEFGLREDNPREEPKATTRGSTKEYYPEDQELRTALSGYNIKESGFEPYCNINRFKDYHTISLSHIESGYTGLYNLIEDIFSDEKKYHDERSEYLNDIYLDITTFMKEVFPRLNKRIGSNDNPKRRNISSGEESYDVSSFLSELINSIEGGSSYLSEVNTNEIYCVDVKTNEHDPSTIASSKEPILPKFEKEIWSRLITKYGKIVKELQVEQKKIIDEESQWNNSIQDIIVTYKIGFSIKGKCKDCEKILSEKKIINIRPPEINK